MWCSETWDCACFKPVQLWVFLSSKIIHMNGGPTMPDMMYPSFISTKLLRVYDCCPLRKIISVWFYTEAIKKIFENCVLNSSTVWSSSFLLTMRKMSSVWQEYRVIMAGHRILWKYLTLFSLGPHRTQWGRQIVWWAQCGVWRRRYHLNISRCICRHWHLLPCLL